MVCSSRYVPAMVVHRRRISRFPVPQSVVVVCDSKAIGGRGRTGVHITPNLPPLASKSSAERSVHWHRRLLGVRGVHRANLELSGLPSARGPDASYRALAARITAWYGLGATCAIQYYGATEQADDIISREYRHVRVSYGEDRIKITQTVQSHVGSRSSGVEVNAGEGVDELADCSEVDGLGHAVIETDVSTLFLRLLAEFGGQRDDGNFQA